MGNFSVSPKHSTHFQQCSMHMVVCSIKYYFLHSTKADFLDEIKSIDSTCCLSLRMTLFSSSLPERTCLF